MSLHVACSSSSLLVADCAVMLASLATVNPSAGIHVHFMYDDGLNRSDLVDLGAFARACGVAWNPILVSGEVTAKLPYTERYGSNVWYRILLPQLLPDLERVLYLDSDLVIIDNVQALFDLPLDGACLAAVTQPTPPDMLGRLQTTLGLPNADSYFNTGVMTLDLERLRQGGYVDQILAFIAKQPGLLPWADQDALNALLHERWLRLGPRWNLMTPVFDLPAQRLPWTAEEVRDAIAAPAIVHFIGPYKPWHYRCRHPYRDAYFRYLASTPWKGKRIEGRTVRNMVVRPLPPRWQPRIDDTVDRGIAKTVKTFGRLRSSPSRSAPQ